MQSKQKSYIWLSLISVLMALLMCIPLSVTSFAYNGDGEVIEGLPSEKVSVDIGWGYKNSGYRIYLVDYNTGKLLSDSDGYLVTDILNKEHNYNSATYNSKSAYGHYTVRTDLSANITEILTQTMPSSMPLPMLGSYKGQGKELRAWMTAKAKSTDWTGKKYFENYTNAALLVYNYLGEEASEKLAAGKAKLVVEPVHVIPLWTNYLYSSADAAYRKYPNYNTNSSGKKSYFINARFYGTYYESLKELDGTGAYKFSGYSHGFMSTVTKSMIVAFYLDKDEFGLKAPTESQINSPNTYKHADKIGNIGFGLHIYDVTPSTPPPTTIKVYYHLYNSSDVQTSLKTSTFDLGTSTTKQFTPSTAYGTPVAACVETEYPTTNHYTAEQYRVREVGNPDKTDKLTATLTVTSSDVSNNYTIHVKVIDTAPPPATVKVPVYYYYYDGYGNQTSCSSSVESYVELNKTYTPPTKSGYTAKV